MIISKIQSIFMSIGFIVSLVVVGLCIGLTIFSVFLSNAAATTTASPHVFGIEYRCDNYSCESSE